METRDSYNNTTQTAAATVNSPAAPRLSTVVDAPLVGADWSAADVAATFDDPAVPAAAPAAATPEPVALDAAALSDGDAPDDAPADPDGVAPLDGADAPPTGAAPDGAAPPGAAAPADGSVELAVEAFAAAR